MEDRKKRRRYCMAVTTCQIHPTERLTLLAVTEPMSLVPKLVFDSGTESPLRLLDQLL